MPIRILAVSPDNPRSDRLAEAVGALAAGLVLAVPTETVYGLAADSFHRDALRRLNRIKRKREDSPILLLAADLEQACRVAGRLPPEFEPLAERFWPGPLTVVVPAAPDLPEEVSGGRGTVAVRVPGLALPRSMAGELGRPVTGVSANLHGAPPCRNAEEVVRVLGDEVDMVLDGGQAPGSAPSTIVDLTGPVPRVLRAGIIPVSALAPFLAGLTLRSL